MPGVLTKLKSIYKSLPESEKSVADYVGKNPEKMALVSITELAGAAKVSVASVSRLSKNLGYDHFKKFKADIVQELLPDNNIASIYQAIKPQDSNETIIEKAFLGNIKSLEETLKILNRNDLEKAAKQISQTSRLVCFGIGSSGHIAKDAALRFTLLDIQAEAYTDSQEIVVQALRMKKAEIALGFSHSGRSRLTIEALKLASKNGARTIGISNYLHSPLHEVSDIFLCTSFSESRVKVAALSSRIAQMGLVDAVYLLTARYKKIFKKAELFNEYAEEFLRIPEKK